MQTEETAILEAEQDSFEHRLTPEDRAELDAMTPEVRAQTILRMEFLGELEAGTITRNQKGRFVPGNPGGPGRPKKLTHEIFWEKVKERLTPEAFDEIIAVTVEQARSGDAKARDAIVRLLTAKEGSLQAFEMSKQVREREEAQERIIATYAKLLTKPNPFEVVDGESIAEKIYQLFRANSTNATLTPLI